MGGNARCLTPVWCPSLRASPVTCPSGIPVQRGTVVEKLTEELVGSAEDARRLLDKCEGGPPVYRIANEVDSVGALSCCKRKAYRICGIAPFTQTKWRVDTLHSACTQMRASARTCRNKDTRASAVPSRARDCCLLVPLSVTGVQGFPTGAGALPEAFGSPAQLPGSQTSMISAYVCYVLLSPVRLLRQLRGLRGRHC